MGLVVLFLYLLGVSLLAYGFSLIFAPLLFVTPGVFCLVPAVILGRTIKR